MSDLRDLYQEVILDHSKKPRNFSVLKDYNRKADGHNPLCGDKLTLYLKLDGDVVSDLSFQGSGCAISTASASMLTEMIRGKKISEVESLFQKFHHMLTEDAENPHQADLGKLEVFEGVKEFPMRVKCATLCWHTMKKAIENDHEVAKTE